MKKQDMYEIFLENNGLVTHPVRRNSDPLAPPNDGVDTLILKKPVGMLFK